MALGGLLGLVTGLAFIASGQMWLGITALCCGALEIICAIKSTAGKNTGH